MSVRTVLACLLTLAVATPAAAQIPLIIPIPGKTAKPTVIGAPPNTPPAEAEILPFPPPDPKSWWDDKRLKPSEASDPLGGRRLRKGELQAAPDNGVAPSTYRLWGLMPLQWQLVRGDEMILEVWTRPSNSVRQTVTRITVRGDGHAFVQGRAGLACCEAGIGRRMGFDDELPPGSAARFLALRDLPLWRSPRDVRVVEPGAADALCLVGTAYDITLVTPGRAVTLHRACDPAEVGEAADVLEAALGAALGHDARFDVVFPGGANFANARGAYRDLVEGGGRLKVNPDARLPPPGAEPAPQPEPETPPEVTPPPSGPTSAPSGPGSAHPSPPPPSPRGSPGDGQ
ncbi:hypothetical protein [Phenylobacterium sp.]|uniref:hypothetical protein n=1 Tax=Phenylobacterium sp. TaxID=1871053 RepID=UPI0025D2CB24|nr:hypothetical protein [Phenylobacterium sp.]